MYCLNLGRDLLKRATEFDADDGDATSGDMGFVRLEVIQDFIEKALHVQLAPKIAAALNALTQNPGSLRPEYVAPLLAKILSAGGGGVDT